MITAWEDGRRNSRGGGFPGYTFIKGETLRTGVLILGPGRTHLSFRCDTSNLDVTKSQVEQTINGFSVFVEPRRKPDGIRELLAPKLRTKVQKVNHIARSSYTLTSKLRISSSGAWSFGLRGSSRDLMANRCPSSGSDAVKACKVGITSHLEVHNQHDVAPFSPRSLFHARIPLTSSPVYPSPRITDIKQEQGSTGKQ